MDTKLVEKLYDADEKSAKLGDFSEAAGGNQRMKTAIKLIKQSHPLRKTPLYQAFPLFGRLSWDHFHKYDEEVQILENLNQSQVSCAPEYPFALEKTFVADQD